MPSVSLQTWRTERQSALNELEAAHKSLGGTARGRRYTTQQINHAYAMILSSQFQGFCRDLHTECVESFVQGVPNGILRTTFRNVLIRDRKLDKGNPNPGNIGSDFNQFGLPFWDAVKNVDVRNRQRQDLLGELNNWRNAIAHQDFDSAMVGSGILRLQRVQRWRHACNQLGSSFDTVMQLHLQRANGVSPW